MRNKSICICVTNSLLSLFLSFPPCFSFLISLPFYNHLLYTAIESSTRNIVGGARTTSHWCAAFLFHLIILKNDPWPTKAAITCTNDGEKSLASHQCFRIGTTDDSKTMLFSIFDEYRRNECGIESFHRPLDRVVSSLP